MLYIGKEGNRMKVLKIMLFMSFMPITFLILQGCSTIDVREGPAPGVRVDDPRAPQARIRFDNAVVILDKSLQQWDAKAYRPKLYGKVFHPEEEAKKNSKIAVEATNSRRTPTGTLEVWAELRNRTNYPLQIEGRTTFFDKDKAPVDGPTAWQRVFLPSQGIGVYKELSTKIEEVNIYYIELREGR
jgi:hypothetical protein